MDHPRRPWRAGLIAARAHIVPGLVLQAVGLALVLGYYFWPPARAALTEVMSFKIRLGFAFGMISTMIFGGLIPWFYLWRGGRYSFAQGGWLLLFWAGKGWEVDVLYRLEARWFGAGHDAATILCKVAFDQFVYSPLWAVPCMVVFYDWLDRAGSRRSVRLAPWSRVLPLLISNLGVWLPMTALIYLLPTALQLPLQNLVLCFFTLLVAHQSRRPRPPAGGPGLTPI